MSRNLPLKIPDVGIQRESQLSPLDVVIHDLDENMLLDDVFCSELKKYNPLYEDGENVVDSVNRIRRSRTRSEEEILEDFMVTADSLGLHIDLGDTKVSEKIMKNKEIVRKGLEEIKLSIDYEKRHLVGRQKDIETIWNALTQKDYVGVCISGMGGNGKTTLAEHIGIRLARSGWSFVKIDARERNTLSELIRRILGNFGVIVQFGEGIERLTSQLCSHLEQYKVTQETVLLLDNIDDIHKEWNELLKFLEDLIIALNNNPDNMVQILITSRKKLESDNGIFNFQKMFTESKHDRFNGLCLEVELKPLTSGVLIELIDNLLPDEDLNKISKLLKSRMISVCAHTPLLIHGLCNSIQTKNINIPDIIDSAWTLMTPVTGQYNPNKCIRESFKCLTFEHQKTLISLHVFRTGQFNIEDAKHILNDLDTCSTKLKLMCLKTHHFIEFHVLKSNIYEERCCRFSIHPLISNFLSEEVKTRQMDNIYNNAISSFIILMQKKVSRYENTLETNFKYAHVFLVENEVHFKQYFRLLNMKPATISLEIKVNKQISAVADLVLNNEKKKALIRNLKDQCLKKRNGSMTCLWKIEEAEEYLDEDKISKAENAISEIENELSRRCPDYQMSDVMALLIILMHLKARLYFRKDSFEEAFEAISTAVYILSDVHFTQRTGIERVVMSYTVLHANIYNILGCVLLRQKNRDEAYHCFIEAFSLITGNNHKHRGQKTVLFISNIGSCFYQQGIIIKTNNIRSEHNEHIAKFGEALKYYQKAISLRERMNQQQFGTFAHELTKRGKVYLELNELRKAMIDFVNAFKIHYGIESYPHIYITLSLYYIAKAILLEGQGQLQRGLTDVAKEAFGFANPMFVCVADCIKHSGLIGYEEEYDEIKNNHIWLLKHQSSPQLKKYEDMYKECSSSGHMSVLEKLFSTNMKTRHQDVLEKLKDRSTDELSKMFDEKTKQVLKGIEGHHEKEIAEEIERGVEDLPYHMDIIEDERLINEKDNIFFQNIISKAESEDHQRIINEIKMKLQETNKGSKNESMNLVRHCEEKCQHDQADKGAAAERRKRKSNSDFK